NYSVLITASNGCAITRNFTITEPPVLSASTTQNNVTTFGGNNGTATVTANGGTGSYTYSWAPNGGAAATATGLTAGTYTVTIRDANLCQITRIITIRQPTGVNSVSVPVAATYKIGDALNFTVNFSEAVIVTGTPSLSLTIGATVVNANYLSGSGSSALTFRYIIPSGLTDNDGVTLGSIALNGGTITDALSTAAVLNLNNPGNTSGVLVDAIVPTVSISSNPSLLKKGETSIITFTFNKSPGTSFTWDGSVGDITISGGSLSAISGSGLVYTAIFTPTDNVNVGSASISVNAGSYTDAVGNLGNAGASPSIAYDTQAPSTSITNSSLSNDSGIAGDFITNISSQTIIGSLSASLLTGESVWVSVNNGVSFNNATATTGDTTFGLNTTLVGTNTIQIKVMDAAGNSGTVYTKNYVFDNLAPNIPTNLLVSAGNQENILNWTPNTETDLVLYRVFGGISNNPTTLLQNVSTPTTSYTHTGLTNGTTYYYKIIAVDVAGNESVESAIETATPQAPQVISFAALPVKVYGDADFSPGATASSNLTITYTSSNTNVATIINGNIHIVGQGTTTITALQNGNSAFLAANPQVQTLTINKKVINVLAEAKTKTYGDTDPVLTYTLSPSLVIGDSFSGSLSRVAGENVGIYTINQGSLTLS
ncbi:Ig-like domain-containing protein, partial [Pedobacter glucosidilyticus]|uniref:Ig-like domain-containing protein n=1 Tax=Pedobacter glucosidilyticus TaxID=1122941 RepID=UPI001FE1C439